MTDGRRRARAAGVVLALSAMVAAFAGRAGPRPPRHERQERHERTAGPPSAPPRRPSPRPQLPSRRSRRGPVAAIAAMAAAAGAVAVVAAAVRPSPGRPGAGERVVLYGDSLSVEAGPAFVEALTGGSEAEVEVRALPGIAPCDVLAGVRSDAAAPPDVVVLQFAGNNATPCVQGPAGPLTGPDLAGRYAADLRAAVEILAGAGTEVVLAGLPPAPGLPGGAGELIDHDLRRIVGEWAGRAPGVVRYVPAGAAVAGEGGAYADRLACRDGEGPAEGCQGGTVAVRSPDRIHFCPIGVEVLPCPVHSSGAERYGGEMARGALLALEP